VLFPEHQSDPGYGEPGLGPFFSLQEYWALLTSLLCISYTIGEYYIKINTYPTIV